MKNVIILLFSIVFFSCSSDDAPVETPSADKLVMAVVDFETNVFEGGYVYDIPNYNSTFTLDYSGYQDPNGIETTILEIFYVEQNYKLFKGSIIWAGIGYRSFPYELQNLTPVLTLDYVYPVNGFDLKEGFTTQPINLDSAWSAAQANVEVRAALNANPNQVVKAFVYSPAIGLEQPEYAKYIFFLKN